VKKRLRQMFLRMLGLYKTTGRLLGSKRCQAFNQQLQSKGFAGAGGAKVKRAAGSCHSTESTASP
jgi:hypothetical protein